MKTILNAADEHLALEFLHLLLIVQSHDVERTAYDANLIVEQIGLDYNKKHEKGEKISVNERNRRTSEIRFLEAPICSIIGKRAFYVHTQ